MAEDTHVADGPDLGPGLDEAVEERYGRAEVDGEFADLEDPLREIPDDTEIDVGDVVGDTRIRDTLEALDRDLVALYEVKRRVREIAALLLVDRIRRQIGLTADPPTLHMSFTGNPGTGKTTVARRMGEVLYQLGYIRKGHVVSVTRDDLVGKYVGHTAPKTREVLNRAMGGVLFIDEAYHLYRVDNERDYGQETVEQLLDVMEHGRQDIVVILAGYADKMARFFSDVPGLSSRIGHHIDFPDYSLDELMEIAHLMVDGECYRFSEEAKATFREYLERRMEQPRFANGRSVRNALDRLRMRHANRLWESLDGRGSLTKEELVTIETEDILKSRVFEDPAV